MKTTKENQGPIIILTDSDEQNNPHRVKYYEIILESESEETASKRAKEIIAEEFKKEGKGGLLRGVFIESINPLFEYCILT